MKLLQFDPPGNLDDFDSTQKAAWNEFISNTIDDNINDVKQKLNLRPSDECQFYNPTQTDTTTPFNELPITWIGFPALIARRHPSDKPAAWSEADQLLSTGERPQDEYLEWHVTRGSNNKITRVTFTCEGPEYWEALAHGYPLGYNGPRTTGATGDKNKLLTLYRQFIDPSVQLSDLLDRNGNYDRLNRWNTTDGAMHLNQRNNTLSAEINIAAQATIKRQQGGIILSDPDELIQCARFGSPGRASDPTIGAAVNLLAQSGFAITLQNPVGLYIDGLNTTGWTKPDGSPVGDNYWTILRGKPGMILRAVFEVPAAEGFTVSDLKIGSQPIQFGGQIAEQVAVKLTGVACRPGEFNLQAIDCEPSFFPLAALTPTPAATSLPTRSAQP